MNLKFIGGLLLIVGTSLGGGMLALPAGMAASGFTNTAIALVICWLAMTTCAFYLLEVNLYLPRGANMISMAEKTLGKAGKAITWLTYLLLLYALLSAYISGGSDVFESLLALIGWAPPSTIITAMYVALFAGIVYTGILMVGRINSLLMYAKLFIYFLLLYLVLPHSSLSLLTTGDWHQLKGATMLLITSYGFAIIIPSLRDYFNDDINQLQKVIFYGSLFPLFCYLAWIGAIMAAVPADGAHGLKQLLDSGHEASGLAQSLNNALHQPRIVNLFRLFSSISMFTAFLGVALCLFDFLADGLQMNKKGYSGFLLLGLVFVPPLLLVLTHPGIYILALKYAGLLCVVLLILLPTLMVYRGRYQLFLSGPFKTPGGKAGIFAILSFSAILFYLAF